MESCLYPCVPELNYVIKTKCVHNTEYIRTKSGVCGSVLNSKCGFDMKIIHNKPTYPDNDLACLANVSCAHQYMNPHQTPGNTYILIHD